MTARRTRRGVLGLATAAVLGALLSGCSLPDVSMSPGLSAHTKDAAATTAAPTSAAATDPATASAPATASGRPTGDLDTGSATHTVAAGDRNLVIDWWTDQQAATWTGASSKTVQLSAHVENDTSGVAVQVSRFVATADDGTARTTVTQDSGSFVVTPPYSYSTVLELPTSKASATSLTVSVQFDLLVETKKGSGQFFRQTVLDSITLPLIKEDPK